MKTEAKVYMSHTDYARIVEAAKRASLSVSTFMRKCALDEADRVGVVVYTTLDERQRRFEDFLSVKSGGE